MMKEVRFNFEAESLFSGFFPSASLGDQSLIKRASRIYQEAFIAFQNYYRHANKQVDTTTTLLVGLTCFYSLPIKKFHLSLLRTSIVIVLSNLWLKAYIFFQPIRYQNLNRQYKSIEKILNQRNMTLPYVNELDEHFLNLTNSYLDS